MREKSTCTTCGTQFQPRPNQKGPNVYCSMACRDPLTPLERFWTHVERSDSCWTWTGSHLPDGYGTFRVGSRKDGTWRIERAHRWIYQQTFGLILPGLDVLHRCDNPPCVRPDHLWAGTRGENNADRDRKGRYGRWKQRERAA